MVLYWWGFTIIVFFGFEMSSFNTPIEFLFNNEAVKFICDGMAEDFFSSLMSNFNEPG